MRRAALPFVLFAVIGFIACNAAYCADTSTNTPAQASEPQTDNAQKTMPEKPADRVVVIYFHRTQRCPTCLRMGSYSEEAVLEGFPKEIKTGAVEFRYVDFQDPKNAEIVKAYKIGGPTLIVLKIEKNKVAAIENLTEIWTKNRDKKVFFKYVRDNVAALQKPLPKETARQPENKTSAQRTE